MKVEFLSPRDAYLEFDQILVAAGEISDSEVIASVAATVDSAPLARVDILASAGESCFRDVRVNDSMIYIGYGRFVFVVDVHLGYMRRFSLSGYFGHLYDSRDLDHLDRQISILAASASEVLAFDRKGDLIWKQQDLGIDGVVLHRATPGRIDGEGEWDPPGGWRPFSLRSDTGSIIR
ncbi:hypothetical protein HH212_21020 [Massilia forsythiae]|uniref:Uncharacterized protein n=1 Tax=Massilia forsythiae TaxID=2728020 RepID=A0A7Z2VZR4_9BURK|nr:hypothetical protein [Massilia forsythiae]QJE02194.1 hypothetical protein HH212_21020 [Massilia forsythiae]